jgi:hypothetical protein
VDLISEGVSGAIDDDLHAACLRAIGCSRDLARASIVGRTLQAGHEVFRSHLVRWSPPTPRQRVAAAA